MATHSVKWVGSAGNFTIDDESWSPSEGCAFLIALLTWHNSDFAIHPDSPQSLPVFTDEAHTTLSYSGATVVKATGSLLSPSIVGDVVMSPDDVTTVLSEYTSTITNIVNSTDASSYLSALLVNSRELVRMITAIKQVSDQHTQVEAPTLTERVDGAINKLNNISKGRNNA